MGRKKRNMKGFPLEKTPDSVYLRLRCMQYQDHTFLILERCGNSWNIKEKFTDKELAIGYLLSKYTDERYKWSMKIKTLGGWKCADCGEDDPRLIESHHTIPVLVDPSMANEIGNGECLCLWCHAKRHDGRAKKEILSRLALKLYAFRNDKKLKTRIT